MAGLILRMCAEGLAYSCILRVHVYIGEVVR
jgi:hypothetical protein